MLNNKYHKTTVCLPDSAVGFANKRRQEIAQQRGSRVTMSSYLAELIKQDQRNHEEAKAKG